MSINKILSEEINRIKKVMFPGLINEANILGKLAKSALDDAVKQGVKNVIDDLFKTGARETIERMAVNGAKEIPIGKLLGIYDDVAIRAFGKSYNGLSLAEKSLVKNTVANSLEESDAFLKQTAKNKTFTATIKPGVDDTGKKAIGVADDAGKKGAKVVDDTAGKTKVKSKTTSKAKGKTKKVSTAAKEGTPKSSWGEKLAGFQKWSKTKWGRRILWGAAGIGAGYLLWLTFWGDDDDIPPCLKALVDSEEKFESYLTNGYVTFGNYKFYPENKVELTSADGMVKEGEWSYDESAQQIELEFGNITHTIDCPAALIEPTPEDGSGGGGSGSSDGGGSYRTCTDFPLIQGCKGDKVREIQKCLGGLSADGIWGPKTQSKVESAGYGSDGISQEEYNKIMQNCGKVEASPEEPNVIPTVLNV